jgi:hypothetical protein
MNAGRLITPIFLGLLIATASMANATTVLDGVYGWENPGEAYVPPVGSRQQYAQLFTIQHTGIFSSAEFQVQLDGPISAPLGVQLFRGLPQTSGAAIVETPLASFILPSDTRNDVSLNFLPFNISVNAGESLSLVFLSDDTTGNLRLYAANHAGVGGFYTRLALDNQVPLYSGWHYDYSRLPAIDTLRLKTYVTTNAPPVCTAAQAFPSVLWSPNHQFVPTIVMGVTDPDGDAVTITVTGVTQDEPVNAKGDGNTSPDAVIEAGAASVRAERSGKGNGRVYEVSFKAEDGTGGSCTGKVTVGVPHSMQVGLTAIDDGLRYDSTVP